MLLHAVIIKLFTFVPFSLFQCILLLILALYVKNLDLNLGALLGRVNSSMRVTRKLCVYHRREGGRGTHKDVIPPHIRITFNSDQGSLGWLTTLYCPSMLGY